MKKSIVLVLIILILNIILTSCNENTSKPELELPEISSEVPKPDLNIESLNPSILLQDYDIDEMIKLPYEESLSEGVEVIYNDENFTVFKYLSGFSGTTTIKRTILTNYGINDGKVIYKEYLGFNAAISSQHKSVYKYGFLNSDFSMLTEPIYEMVYPFEHGRAVVQTSDGFGVIDTEGTMILPCEFSKKPELFDNIIRIPDEKTQEMTTYQIYNRLSGDYMYEIKKMYIKVSDTFQIIKINLDNSEEEIFDVSLLGEDELQKYKDMTTRKWGYKNGFGNIIIEPKFSYAYDFIEDMARVVIEGKYGFIDKYGDNTIPCIYSDASDFNKGLARVVFDGDVSYITKDGSKLNDHYYETIKAYGDGLAAAIVNGETNWQYVNEVGESAFNGRFSKAGTFSHGLAPVEGLTTLQGGLYQQNYYYIDMLGNPVFGPLAFQEAKEISDDGYGLAYNRVTEVYEDGDQVWYSDAYQYYIVITKN